MGGSGSGTFVCQGPNRLSDDVNAVARSQTRHSLAGSALSRIAPGSHEAIEYPPAPCAPSGGGAGADAGRERVGLQVERRLQQIVRVVGDTLFSLPRKMFDCVD
jgi:hypothetical protein